MKNRFNLLLSLLLLANCCQAQGKIYFINKSFNENNEFTRKEVAIEYFEVNDLLQIVDSMTGNYSIVVIEDENIRKLPKDVLKQVNTMYLQVITPNLKCVGKYYGDNPNIQTLEIFSDRINFVSLKLYKSTSLRDINIKVSKFSTFARIAVKFNKKHINDYNKNLELWTQEGR